MKIYRIYKHKIGDGLFRRSPYLGETGETESANIGGTKGFHNANHYERNRIKFFTDTGGNEIFMTEAYKIEGGRNLLSHMSLIIYRNPDGILDDADELIITIEEK
jgi:hypothetical protein